MKYSHFQNCQEVRTVGVKEFAKKDKWKRENELWVESSREGSREIRQHGAGGNAEPEVGIEGKMQIKQDRENSQVFIDGSYCHLLESRFFLLTSIYSINFFYLQKTARGISFTQLSC